ncbi:MAG: hypothetical protein NVS9B4_12860 [Candidatus Acidiferrum sp.]
MLQHHGFFNDATRYELGHLIAPDGQRVIANVADPEARRVMAYFDNFPWFADTELAGAIRKKLPFFDGTLPEAGKVLDQASDGIADLLRSRDIKSSVSHEVVANPLGDGSVQMFRVEETGLRIGKIEFSDTSLRESKIIQQHLLEIQGKLYSRMAVDLFLREQVQPIYAQRGYLRCKLGPPEARLSGNPNQKLPEQLPVFVPIATGPVYRLQTVSWSGNTLLSTFTLNSMIGARPGAVADGMAIEGAWDRVREEYAHHGYMEAVVRPEAAFDEQAHTVSYNVSIQEGAQYKFGKMTVTGLSAEGQRRLREAWLTSPEGVFDKTEYETLLTKLQSHPTLVFGELPLHYDKVGHWVQMDKDAHIVDILLDFQ